MRNFQTNITKKDNEYISSDWLRYLRYDIFAIFNTTKHSVHDFLEKKREVNNKLSFLDILIIKNECSRLYNIQIKICYRKYLLYEGEIKPTTEFFMRFSHQTHVHFPTLQYLCDVIYYSESIYFLRSYWLHLSLPRKILRNIG